MIPFSLLGQCPLKSQIQFVQPCCFCRVTVQQPGLPREPPCSPSSLPLSSSPPSLPLCPHPTPSFHLPLLPNTPPTNVIANQGSRINRRQYNRSRSAEISTRPEENFSEEIMLLHDTKTQNAKLLITFFKSAVVLSVLCHGTRIERQMDAFSPVIPRNPLR